MKKRIVVLVGFIIIILFVFLLASCNGIREYKGPKITQITYETVDFNGGVKHTSILDFNENKYSSIHYVPGEGGSSEQNSKEFTDDEEKAFIDTCYTYGLFKLKESYELADKVDDGGSWTLIIKYEDGKEKKSKGKNAGPYEVFDKCAIAFYDICGERIMGTLPIGYTSPPNIDYSLSYTIENYNWSSFGQPKVVRANYKWNGSESLNNDIFALNSTPEMQNEFESGIDYYFSLGTTNYDCYEKFNKITVKKYDYSAELTNEEIVFTGGWISNHKMLLEFNKIYVYEISFKDGKFVQYTFNTKSN